MLALTAAVRLYLFQGKADLRKSFDGLSGLVRNAMEQDPLSGAIYVFCNRRRTLVKFLYWDSDGYAIWMKRLEQGRFRLPTGGSELDVAELTMMLSGIVPLRRLKRYRRGQ